MRDWGYRPPPSELAPVATAQKAFRDRCGSKQLPYSVAFDGSIDDVDVLDYMVYEGIEFPSPALESSAFVCGEVVRRAAALEWVISYRGDWLIASPEESSSSIAICPLARLHELECCGGPTRAVRHLWFVQQAALECLLRCGSEREPMIRELLQEDGEYLTHLQSSLERLQNPDPSEKRDQRAHRSRGKRKRPR
jgi:hypothetical protein